MSVSMMLAAGAKVALFLRGAMVREGVVAAISRVLAHPPESLALEGEHGLGMLTRSDLLIADADTVPQLLARLQGPNRPRRVLVLTTADAPVDMANELRDSACGRLSLHDDETRVDATMRHALGCGNDRLPSTPCANCPLQRTLAPRVLPLSPRERDVFLMIGRGMGASDTALALGISIKTFETYRERIKYKLGLESANELILSAMAWQRGLLGLWWANHPKGPR